MALVFSWEPNLFSILYSTLWIFRDVVLVIWAITTMKKENKPKFTSLLLVAGIFLLSWNIISIFLPSVGIDYFLFPDEAELDMFTTIYFLYSFIPVVLHFFLAVVLVVYIYNVSYHYDKKSLIGPALFLLGNIIYICFNAILYFILLSIDFTDYATLNLLDFLIGVELMTYIVADLILVIGFSFIFIYSIYRNDALLIMFCSLYFAILMLSLFRIINNTIIEFYSW